MTVRIGEPASRCLSAPNAGTSRFVGDPVDIITGAVVDQETEFRLPRAALPLSWVRRFDGRELSHDRGLGRGFRHSFDRELRFDLDGITYVDGAWARTTFPRLARDGQRSTQIGCALQRVDDKHYRVEESDGRSYEFTFSRPDEPARLERVTGAEGALSLYYERLEDREQLYAIGLGMLGRLRIAWANGRISGIALQESEPDHETLLASYRYDERGCLVEAKNAYKHSLRYDFDAELRLAKKTDRRGHAFLFSYDAAGRCVESRGADGAEAVKLEYRPVERSTLVTRHDGGTWQYQYNDAGSVSNVLDPYKGMQSYLFDGRGRVCEEIDPLGNSAKLRFSTLGVAEEKVDALGQVTALPDDPSAPRPLEHRVAETPLELEYGTLFSTPARLPVTGDPLWELPTHVRALIQCAEPEWGGHTRVERSLQGLPFRELREDGKMRHWTFDENANVRRQVDFDGHARLFEYVSDNHLATEKDALGRIIRYEHSATERLTALTDAGGTRSHFVLDLKDRVSEVHRHGKLRERYTYDLGDNLVAKHDGAGQLLLEQTIGAGNRKTTRKLGSGEIQTFAYDEQGRLAEARGNAGSCTFKYDAHTGARIADARQGIGVEHILSAERTTTVLGRFTTRYRRDNARQTTLVDPTGRSHTLIQLGGGIYQRRLSSGAHEISQFDVRGRCLVKALYRSFGDDQPWVRGFRYSGEGDLIERTDRVRGGIRFTYDAAHRLQTIIQSNNRVDGYEYDAGNNLIAMPSVDLPLRTAGERDRFDVGSGNRLRAARGESFEYDDRDHICRRSCGERAIHYRRDSLDQLIEIQAPHYAFHAEYDAIGRRTKKTVNGSTTTYYWDTDRLAAEIFANGALRIYVYASELALVPLLFVDYASTQAAPESGSVFFVFADHLGTVERVLSHSGEEVWRAQLDPYGVAHVETKTPFHQPVRLPGHYYDAETGLHYNRFRYYDPKLGRYLESDPLGLEGGLNLYAYTQNPLKEVDPRGLTSKCPNGVDCPQNKKKSTEDNEAVEGTNVAPAKAKSDAGKSVEVTDQHHAKLKQLAPGVTAHDVALAEHRNLSNPPASDQIGARKKVAEAFYKKNGQEYALKDEHGQPYGTNPATKGPIKRLRPQTKAERDSQLAAVDYNHPVVVGPPPPCKSSMKQWQAEGGDRGSYYADDGVKPGELGIGDEGKSWNLPGQPVGPKVATTHNMNPDSPNLETTAGPADDTWSVPGRTQPAPGGGRQTYIPEGCNPNSTMVH